MQCFDFSLNILRKMKQNLTSKKEFSVFEISRTQKCNLLLSCPVKFPNLSCTGFSVVIYGRPESCPEQDRTGFRAGETCPVDRSDTASVFSQGVNIIHCYLFV